MKPRVEVVFLPPVASLGLHVCTPGAAWGHRREPGEQRKGGMKLKWNGGIERSAGVFQGKVSAWAESQPERWEGELDGLGKPKRKRLK